MIKLQNDAHYAGMLELDPGTSTLRPIRVEVCSAARQDQTWHLTKNGDENNGQTNAGRSNKVISEIFLTRLLSTKVNNTNTLCCHGN